MRIEQGNLPLFFCKLLLAPLVEHREDDGPLGLRQRCRLAARRRQVDLALLDLRAHAAEILIGGLLQLVGCAVLQIELRQAFAQSPQAIVGCLELALLVFQALDRRGHRTPVDPGVIVELQQLLGGAQLLLAHGDLRLYLLALAIEIQQSLPHFILLCLQRSDLGLVVPAQDEARSVVERMTIVLFVPSLPCLDEAAAGDGARQATKFRQVFAARVIEAVGQLALDESIVRAVGPDLQLAQRRMWRHRTRRLPRAVVVNVEEYETPLQMSAIDIVAHLRVVGVGHQQAQREPMEQPFERTLPDRVGRSHAQQLARKRQLRRIDFEDLGECRPYADVVGRDVAVARLQRLDLLRQRLVAVPQLAKIDALVQRLPVQRLLVRIDCVATHASVALRRHECIECGPRTQSQRSTELPIVVVVALSPRPLHLFALDLGLDLAQPAATLQLDRRAHVGPLARECIQPLGLLREPLLEPGDVEGKRLDALREEPRARRRKVSGQSFPCPAMQCELRCERVQLDTVGNQRRQPGDLIARSQHCFVRLVEVLEVADQAADALLGIVRLEHVTTNEIGEVADGLHRHRLVEQIERLRMRYAELAAHPLSVLLETVEERDRRLRTNALAQSVDVRAEIREVLGNAQCSVGDDVEPPRCTFALTQPEDLRERHRAIVRRIGEQAENDTVGVVAAQRLRLGASRQLIRHCAEFTANVRIQRTLASLGARGLVVGDPARGDEQRRQCIDQSRLAGTDVTGEQRILAIGCDAPDVRVERAPVQDLEAREAKVGPDQARRRCVWR